MFGSFYDRTETCYDITLHITLGIRVFSCPDDIHEGNSRCLFDLAALFTPKTFQGRDCLEVVL